jgi:hypothetical protein
MPAEEPSASSALGKALSGVRQGLPPFARKDKMKASSPCGEGSLRDKASSLAGRKWRAREGSGPVPKDKTSGRVASVSCQDLCVTPGERAWETRGGSPLRRTCRRHHYHTRRGNDGLDRLVKSHRCSALDGAKDSSGPCPAGLRHRSESCGICQACGLATVVSP